MGFRKLAYPFLAALSSAILGFGVLYAFKPGNCPPMELNNNYGRFDVAFVYGGGPEATLFRADNAAYLGKQNIAGYFLPLGGDHEIDAIVDELVLQGALTENIVRPETISRSTRENIQVGYQTVKSRNLGTRIAHVSSKRHLPRIRMLNEELGLMNPHDDGYFGDFETRYGTPILKLFPRLDAMVYDSDVREWLACVVNRR